MVQTEPNRTGGWSVCVCVCVCVCVWDRERERFLSGTSSEHSKKSHRASGLRKECPSTGRVTENKQSRWDKKSLWNSLGGSIQDQGHMKQRLPPEALGAHGLEHSYLPLNSGALTWGSRNFKATNHSRIWEAVVWSLTEITELFITLQFLQN